jgi:hypothetical protein
MENFNEIYHEWGVESPDNKVSPEMKLLQTQYKNLTGDEKEYFVLQPKIERLDEKIHELGEEFNGIADKSAEEIRGYQERINVLLSLKIQYEKFLSEFSEKRSKITEKLGEGRLEEIVDLRNKIDEQTVRDGIKNSANFDELIDFLGNVKSISGSSEVYSGEHLQNLVRRVRNSEEPIGKITNALGLREKVRELMKK